MAHVNPIFYESTGLLKISTAAYVASTVFASSIHWHGADTITTSTFALDRMGTGTPNISTFLAGDGSWIVPVYTNISSLPALGTAASTAAANYALATHFHGANAITTSTFDLGRLGSGTTNISTFLSGASSWAQPSYSSLANLPTIGTAASTAAANYALASHFHGADAVTTSTFALARLGSGTTNISTFLSGNSTFIQPSFSSLSNLPTLGTAASTNASAYATTSADSITASTFALARLAGGTTNISTFLNGTSSFTQPVYGNLSGLPVILSATSSVRVTSIKNSTTTSSLPIPELAFTVSNTIAYAFTFGLVYASAISSTGLNVGLLIPAVSSFSARAVIPVAASGTDADMSGYIIASGGTVIAPTTPLASTKYCAMITGTILPSANGTLQLSYGTEVAGSAISTFVGSYGIINTI